MTDDNLAQVTADINEAIEVLHKSTITNSPAYWYCGYCDTTYATKDVPVFPHAENCKRELDQFIEEANAKNN